MFTLGLCAGGSVGGASGYHAGGCEFDSGRTNTQGLKNNCVENVAFVIKSANGWKFKSSRMRTINRSSRLKDNFHFKTLSNPQTIRKEYVGHEVPGVVAVLCECMGG